MISPAASGRDNSGFTLIEVAIAFALLALIGGLGLVMGLGFFRGYGLRYDAGVLESVLQTARSQAMANIGSVPHGVFLASDSYTLFEGVSYALRDPERDQSFPLESGVFVNGPTQIVFDPLSGRVANPGDVTIENHEKSATLHISHEGSILP